jgi:hypothetical protein
MAEHVGVNLDPRLMLMQSLPACDINHELGRRICEGLGIFRSCLAKQKMKTPGEVDLPGSDYCEPVEGLGAGGLARLT